MILLTVLLKHSPHVIQLHFNSHKDAEKRLNVFNSAPTGDLTPLDDDYGCFALIERHEVAGVFLTDLEREMAAHHDVDVCKHKKDMKVAKTMQHDPATRLLTPNRANQ